MVPSSAILAPISPQAWQEQLAHGVEAGQTPLLTVGLSQRLLDSWVAQTTLATFDQSRTDIVTPTVLIGGNSTLWPVMLLHPPTAGTAPAAAAPPLALLYGGADQATYMASMTTVAADRLLAGTGRAHDLPASMHPALVPLTNPTVPLSWSALALSLCPPAPQAQPTTTVDPWLLWSTFSLVLLLVLLALFV